LHDGRAGNARQALALARALDAAAQVHVLQPGLLARWLAPRRWPLSLTPFGPEFRAACNAPPALAIGCGRQAALATRVLRSHGSQAVQILDPRIDARHWDVLVVPEHDAVRGGNVIPMAGSLHPVDDGYLLRAISAFPALAMLPTPHTVLLVGGPTRHAPLSDAAFTACLQQLAALAKADAGSFSAIASRRTPPAWRAALAEVPRTIAGLRWRDTGDGPNPYAGLLATADRIVCTPDSVNMLSEAAATYAPLYIVQPQLAQGRLRQCHQHLQDRGRARPLTDAPALFDSTPLRETERVAAAVRQRLALPARR
jgi:hypothetical protein